MAMPSTTGSKQGELKCARPCCSACCRVGWYQCCDGTSCFVALRRLYEFQNCVYEPKIAPLLIRADNVKLRIMQASWGLHQGEEDKHHCLSQALTSLAAQNCGALGLLPDSLGELAALKTLQLSNSDLRLLPRIGAGGAHAVGGARLGGGDVLH